ncbi:expression site-associated gene 11 (ESAG11) protein, putative [Trypanosoma equiperdum]|uniref:Expression site-associated gene 11 (ESAG11) protein, putative n=1 Tax=Trypanosoma equiperdum TaxID=5694 RepID=A0A1G4I0T8_TRYEQ|nr:expression site-associated gene 11 (ESAG11) protein, putative [Trypanosoma equiperdum]
MRVISLFLAVCLTVFGIVTGTVEGQPSGKAMTLKGAEMLCDLSYALRAVSAEIQKKHQNATGMVDKFREWRHRHGVKGRTWKAIVQGLEKIGVVNGSDMENIKNTYVKMEKVMNNMDEALQVMDASFLDIVVVLFEKTKEESKYCCLVKEKTTSAGGENGCGSGGGGDCKYEAADAPNKCNMSFTEDYSDDGVLSVLNKYKANQEVELTADNSTKCWIMGTEDVANGGPGSFIVGTTGGFVTYKKDSDVILKSSEMVPELVKNYTLVRKGYESIKDKYNELKLKFGPFDEYENKLKELLTQSPIVRRYFKESGRKRKGRIHNEKETYPSKFNIFCSNVGYVIQCCILCNDFVIGITNLESTSR